MDTANQIQVVKMDASSLSLNSYSPRTSTLQIGAESLRQVDPTTTLVISIVAPAPVASEKSIVRNPS